MQTRKIGRMVLIGILAFSLVTQPVSATMTGGNSAIQSPDGMQDTTTDKTCDVLTATGYFATAGIWDYDTIKEGCKKYLGTADTSEEVDAVIDAKTNQTKIDIAYAANSQQAQFQLYKTQTENYLEDAQMAAWANAEVAVANYYANTSNPTETEARSHARQAIKDYWSVKQANLIKSHNTQMAATQGLDERAENESISESFVAQYSGDTSDSDLYVIEAPDTTVTLANGSQINVWAYTSDSVGNKFVFKDMIPSDFGFRVQNTSQTPRIVTANLGWYKDKWHVMDDYQAEQVNTSYNWIEPLWSGLESGEIDPSMITSRTTDMYRMSPGGDGDVPVYRAIAATSSMGLEFPNMNGTGTMRIRYNGSTYEGMLLSNSAPSSMWESGVTYDLKPFEANDGKPNVSGAVYMATTGGNQFALKDEFTVKSITNKEGENIQYVNTTKTVYKTANTSEYIERMETLLNESRAINARLADELSSTQPDNSSSTLPPWLTQKVVGIPVYGILIVLMLLAYAINATKK